MGSPSSVAEPDRLALSVGSVMLTAEPAFATGAALAGGGGGGGGGGGAVPLPVLSPPPPPQAASKVLASAAVDQAPRVRALAVTRSDLMMIIPFS